MSVKNIGKKIEEALREKGISRRELAEQLQGTHHMVSSWINGIHYPPLESLEKIMNLTGKDANFFFDCISISGNNIFGNNNQNINQTIHNFSELELLKKRVRNLEKIIIQIQKEKTK